MDNNSDKQLNEDVNKDTIVKIKEENAVDQDKWGYAVCFGTVITFIAGIGHVNSFGLIYHDFVSNTHSTAKSLTTSHGVFAVMLAVGGIILNIASKKVSLRLGGIFGAFIMVTGSLSTIFISDANQLSFTFGVLQGVGFGMMVPVCYSTVNYYYVKKRTTVMSICKALQGIILMWYPQLLKMVLANYGFRGTLLILSGIGLHTIPGMLVMDTREKQHMKRNIRTANKVEDLHNDHENVELLDSKLNGQEHKNIKEKISEICSEILHILNVKVLKDLVYCNICVGQSFVNFSDLTFFIFQPMLLFQYGYDTSQVAACISICAVADVVGRCGLALISSIIVVNTRSLYYGATFFTLLFRLVILQLRQFIWVSILTATLGVLRALLHVTSPLVISNHVSHVDFPGAYALFMLFAGLVNVTFAPVIGILKDIHEDYIPAFYALTACCLPCLILWPVEYIIRNK